MSKKKNTGEIDRLNGEIVRCRKCPRLVAYREAVAREKRLSFRQWDYWGKPVPGFGDPAAEVARSRPRACRARRQSHRAHVHWHGDRSGDFLYKAMYNTGFASQPTSVRLGDGLQLSNAYISAAARCAPPANKPLPSELANCRPYLERDLEILRPHAILVLGSIAMRVYLGILKHQGKIQSFASFRFAHAATYSFGDALPRLFASYHPSQQNTFTGKLTEKMLEDVLDSIRRFLSASAGSP